jgi:hypothetical protein
VVGLDEGLWESMTEACELVESSRLNVAFISAGTTCEIWDKAIGE